MRGRYLVPRPLTLHQLGERLGCSLVRVRALVRARCFPHAYVDCEGKWRIPTADVAAYVRTGAAIGAPFALVIG